MGVSPFNLSPSLTKICVTISSSNRMLILCELALNTGTPHDGLYGEAPPERGNVFRLQVYERAVTTLAEVYKRVGKSVIWVCEFYGFIKSRKRSMFGINSYLKTVYLQPGLQGSPLFTFITCWNHLD